MLHGLGLEARYAGFGGWGYVAGWNKDGQWVDFSREGAARLYTLGFRYAAGAGDASRLVYVNGQDLVANQAFSATATWDAYNTVDVPVTLPPRAQSRSSTTAAKAAPGSSTSIGCS